MALASITSTFAVSSDLSVTLCEELSYYFEYTLLFDSSREILRLTNASKPENPIIFFKPISTLISSDEGIIKVIKRNNSKFLKRAFTFTFFNANFLKIILLLCYFFQVPKVFDKINYEAELGVIIGKSCKDVNPDQAMSCVAGYCLALDMTGMDFIVDARPKGLPWCLGKAFDTSTPVSRFISPEELGDPNDVRVWCKVNEQMKQDDSTRNLIFTVSY